MVLILRLKAICSVILFLRKATSAKPEQETLNKEVTTSKYPPPTAIKFLQNFHCSFNISAVFRRYGFATLKIQLTAMIFKFRGRVCLDAKRYLSEAGLG